MIATQPSTGPSPPLIRRQAPAQDQQQQQQQQPQQLPQPQQQQQQGTAPGDGSPSPPSLDRNRTIRGPPAGYASQSQAPTYAPAQQAPSAQVLPPEPGSAPPAPASMASQQPHHYPPPPQPAHAHSQPVVHTIGNGTQQQQAYPPRLHQRASLPLYPSFQPSAELMAEVEMRAGAPYAQPDAPLIAAGLGGLAYAGGAGSGPTERDWERAQEMLTRRGSKGKETFVAYTGQALQQPGHPQQQPQQQAHLQQQTQQQTQQQQSQQPPAEHLGYREAYIPLPAPGRSPTPPPQPTHARNKSSGYERVTPPTASVLRDTPPGGARLRDTPPGQGKHTPDRDKSLPVQEEPEEPEDWRREPPSPLPSSDVLPERERFERVGEERRGQVEEGVQVEDAHDDEDVSAQREEDEESYTPRSPVSGLPPVSMKTRQGAADGRRMHSYDPSAFERTPAHDPGEYRAPARDTGEYRAPAHDPRAHDQALHADYVLPRDDPRMSHIFDDPYFAYYEYAPDAAVVRPDAPIPPTPHSQTAAPSPITAFRSRNLGVRGPFSPVPGHGSPYPYPYGHIRRTAAGVGGGAYAPSVGTGTLDMDPASIREQLELQMRVYARNNGGMVTDSTLSPSASPFPGPAYNPWTFLQTSRVYGAHPIQRAGSTTGASMRSSPSHEPLPLPSTHARPPLRRRPRPKPANGAPKRVPPPRVQSTQPRDTSPEPSSSSGEETAGEVRAGGVADEAAWAGGGEEEDGFDEDAWVDEEEDGEDLLQLEFHTDYVGNAEKRRRRWRTRWDALVHAVSPLSLSFRSGRVARRGLAHCRKEDGRTPIPRRAPRCFRQVWTGWLTHRLQFNALDRETDTTMVLMAAPPHTSALHLLRSRAVRRDRTLSTTDLRRAFAQLAAQRAARRTRTPSLLERFTPPRGADADETNAELRAALDAAVGSLSALHQIYNEREVRWAEEMRRLDEDRERVRMLLGQVLGVPGEAAGIGVKRGSAAEASVNEDSGVGDV
ncbi:hypothetical protein K488DRAFT_88390 [Vararia minispora EC-137]|uniref:Uncharacterized protein n=1 Tax=Vararia minispora EC-137 TaxID=1314806 RepID=A0ACB8QDY2_9AGAM|nr:hypothetical protein K488DRAFT_88390 [Vararia minispora EC-137]